MRYTHVNSTIQDERMGSKQGKQYNVYLTSYVNIPFLKMNYYIPRKIYIHRLEKAMDIQSECISVSAMVLHESLIHLEEWKGGGILVLPSNAVT